MIPLRLDEVAAITGGIVHDGGDEPPVVVGPAFLDSRQGAPGGLFVAIAGDRVDGHDYAGAAVEAGAAAALGSRPTGVPTVVVSDPVAALGLLARHVVETLRHRTGLVVVALTGSQGKTGTKDYLAALLASAGPTVATLGNLNNELGVPLTMLRADLGTRHLVLEMGARGVGHIAYLCGLAAPQIAMVLNVGTAHLGEFGSREAIAVAKGEIVESLPADGLAVLNADDPLVAAMAPRTRAPIRTFGGPGADVAGIDVDLDATGRAHFTLVQGDARASVRLDQVGAHQVANAVAAAAVATALGIGVPSVAAVLSATGPASRWRMETTERADGTVVINDAYNANPASMRAALDTLAAIGRGRAARTVAVLGEMRELGEQAAAEHHALGRYAADLDIDRLVLVGAVGEQISAGARQVDRWRGEAILTPTPDDAVAWVRENVAAGDVVVVKASRGVALEHVAAALLDTAEDGEEPR